MEPNVMVRNNEILPRLPVIMDSSYYDVRLFEWEIMRAPGIELRPGAPKTHGTYPAASTTQLAQLLSCCKPTRDLANRLSSDNTFVPLLSLIIVLMSKLFFRNFNSNIIVNIVKTISQRIISRARVYIPLNPWGEEVIYKP